VPYSESLAHRVRPLLSGERGFAEKQMFGGIGFLLHGNMCVGVWQDCLIVRVGPELYQDTLARPFAREFDITGRAMTGWVMVEPDGLDAERDLREWVARAVGFVTTLPAKQGTKRVSRKVRTPLRPVRLQKGGRPRGNR
jgi:TfoX/Sxy family transcriptional regulator of competence genes